VAVETAKVATADLTEGIEVVGSLAPKFEANVKPEYAGMAREIYVTEWVRVKKGDLLAKLDTREIDVLVQKAQAAVEAARAALLQAEAAHARAKRELARLLGLKDSGLITQQNLDDAKTNEEVTQAQVAAAKAQLRVVQDDLTYARTKGAKAEVSAPMDGIISFRGANVGDMVGEQGSSKIMFKIVDNRLLDLTVTVPSKDIGRLKLGQPLTFTTDAFPGRTFSGKVMFLNPSVSETDRSLKVVAEVPNPDETLRGGMFVKGMIVTGTRQAVLVLPRTTLVTWDVAGGKAEVFLVEGDAAKRVTVKTGLASGERVEVVEGLKAGDEIITRGWFNVKDGDKIKVAR
jgi:RND family efflux transporter MFP subunit